MNNMVGKECKMQRTRLYNISTANLSTLSPLFFVCPEHSPHSHCLVDHHSIPGAVVKFSAGFEIFTSLERSPYPEGRVVRSPRAGKSKGRQNEYFK